MLTDKAKNDFFQWRKENGYEVTFSQSSSQGSAESFDKLYQIYESALIIEWFDSIGVYIHIEAYVSFNERILFKNYILNHANIDEQNSYIDRNSSIESAIKKANEIYNTQ